MKDLQQYYIYLRNWKISILVLLIASFFACDNEDADKLNFDSQFDHFTDTRDSHTYKLIKIGSQTWMAENLAYLPNVFAPGNLSRTQERYYVYGYNGSTIDEATSVETYNQYGVLYNWTAAINSCPQGWHLPTDKEWETFEKFIIDSYGPVNKRDSIAFAVMAPFGWENYLSIDSVNIGNTSRNKSLFSAIPSGYLYFDGAFHSGGNSAFWWVDNSNSENNASAYVLSNNSLNFQQYNFGREVGFSVRCVKN